jgi:tripartite-type tricarboxylate transporter receptor subunit TctC
MKASACKSEAPLRRLAPPGNERRLMTQHPRRRILSLAAGAIALPAVSGKAWGQAYPSRPVRMIVPFAPGGPTDIFARLVAQKMSEGLGRQFYVENVVGATGNIGTAQAAKAPPDGYTILINASNFAINPVFFDKVPYDPYKDFEPVTLAVTNTVALVINPSIPVKTVRDLVGLIKAGSGRYAFASGGTGSLTHLLGEQLRLSLGLDLVHVPYGGGGPSVASVVAGHTQMVFTSTPQAASQIKEGTLRAIAVTSKTRSQLLPDVPTFAEAGYPNIEGDAWVGVFVPARTPKVIITLLNREIAKSMALPDIKERFEPLGFELVSSAPEEFAKQIWTEVDTWGKLLRAANIKPN